MTIRLDINAVFERLSRQPTTGGFFQVLFGWVDFVQAGAP